MTKLPMSVLSGYLGAGKTTFLNRLLRDPGDTRYAVLINDFGDIAIDEALIENQTGDTLALTNGCVCCSIGGDLYDAIDQLLQSDTPADHLILEASGVADPFKLTQIAEAEPDLRNAGVLTLVDAVNLGGQLADTHLADSVRRQIAAADQIAVTKSDLVDADLVLDHLATLAQIAPDRTISVVTDQRPSALLPSQGAQRAAGHGGHAHYATWSYRGDARADANPWRDACLRAGALRMKGFLNTPEGRVLVHLSGQHWQADPVAPGPTELVVIGLEARLNTAPLVELLEAVDA